ncbi:autotransporter secretion inner membrane protein TamB [Aliiroseovarius halocynthiae]|uniref:Translocation and assembly module TamB C-terminal domain-containing protein n=1 Tax=Aliiroseovarius halocynthiae TaxID=985055 RepID=A0A545SVK4_9RHOB|nr:translocation/assembly module TamB domain-containing protein [Aliiroseovarius halocynthiae]TQV68991.1 hypothetical protein FIL88_05300 [Aliiroseovarius halocynthiae]SMR71736.1 autotransporter secretion inner membrane protein TamB [Aliiroseovarius halocynthiae]
MFHRILPVLITLIILPFMAMGQSNDASAVDDRGYIQALLEDNLSDTGREIKIIGFQGALSSQATVDEITIADSEGIWLSMRGLTLSWTRSALLTGNVKIDALEADEISLLRQPIPDPGLPSPEASGFALPELPVSLNIGSIRAGRVNLGEDILGAAAAISLQGSASLESGAGHIDFDVTRLDGPTGALELAGSYDNTTRILSLALALDEAENGLAASILNIPDRPALGLSVKGDGPLADFKAQIALATDGQERLSGSVTVLETLAASEQAGDTKPDRQFAVDLSGDLTPLVHSDYHGFFGDAVNLTARAAQAANGATRIETLSLTSASLSLTGDMTLAPGGWPERLALNGQIASPDGSPVRLPMSGPPTLVSSVDLNLAYDAQTGDLWTASANLSNLTQDALRLDAARLTGSGQLVQGNAETDPVINGALQVDLRSIDPGSPELAAAIGSDLSGTLRFDWLDDTILAISGLNLAGADYDLTGALTLSDFAEGVVLRSEELRLTAHDLSRFSGVAGAPLSGRVGLDVSGETNLLGGAFNIALNGRGADLGVNQPQLDALVGGQSSLDVQAVRDADGTRVSVFKLETDKARLDGSADLKTQGSTAALTLNLPNSGAVDPKLTGPAQLSAILTQAGANWQVNKSFTGPGNAELTASSLLGFVDGVLDQIDISAQGKIAQLAPYSGQAQRRLSGGLTFEATGNMRPDTGSFSVSLDGTTQSLGTGKSQVDAILRGTTTLSLKAGRDGDAPILLDRLNLRNEALTLTAEGQPSDDGTRVTFQSRLSNLGLLADGITGPAQAQGSAELAADTWRISVDGTGPAGVNGRVNGTISTDGARADLTMSGTAPLALANPAIRPRLATGTASYDLALRGPLDLSSLTGSIATQNARLALPRLRQSIDIDSGQVNLDNGTANVNIQSSIPAGGRISTSGSIGLTAPMQADLSLFLNQLRLTDGALFETTIDGTANLRGPLQGGATLRAALTLGRTELRIPETAPGTLPVMEGLEHVGEPTAVRQTRKFAGLIVAPSTTAPARPYPLDITLNAPGQIFVRGRGLDAELGGSLRVTGTSANVIPQGEFNLIRGRLDMLGKRLTLTEGDVSLQGDFNAYLRFLATAKAEDTDIRIGVTGPASAPEISFTSSPELPEDEVLARLLFGKDITQISAIQALRLAAAVRTLAGKGGEGVLGRLRGEFALDDLDVTTDETGAASVRAGKYISENIYTDVTVGAEGKAEVNLNLTLTPSLTARGTLGSDGNTGVGVYFERDY